MQCKLKKCLFSMGSSSSKFRRHLQNGDEYAALQVFQNTPELRHNLDPNCSYGDSLQHNSPLHLAARHAMKPLLRIFLNELGGNPNKCNVSNETALHLACQGNLMRSLSTQERRVACVLLILQWQGVSFEGECEKIDLAAIDDAGNTALHYASATGLKKCTEILVLHGAPLFVENKCFFTACDLAEKNGHGEIAQFLETKMVFSTDFCDGVQEIIHTCNSEETFNGLRSQDLQEAKDQLLVETSDMLHVPLFTAEVLLRNHEWSRQSLLEAWMKDSVECCQNSGIQPPTSALHSGVSKNGLGLKVFCEKVQDEYQSETLNSPARNVPLEAETMCDICANYISVDEDPVPVPCQHQFCRHCWQGYLTVKIQNGDIHNILCPAFECHHLVPVDIIEKLVSPDMVKRYLQFDIEAFVESNPSIQWCPYPGCGRAVKLPEIEDIPQQLFSVSCTSPQVVSHSVDCGNGHYFCWECLGEAHAPCGCEKWNEWHEKIAEIKPLELKNTCAKTEDAANCLWMVTNSKPCPNCKSPIQKNEGCNHMKCSKCKYDFCWVCLEGWKKHSSATGGYFRCNRYDAVQRAEVRTGILISEAEANNKQMQELKRFLHYYTKFKNHENCYKIEEPLLESVKEKMKVLEAAIRNLIPSDLDTNFLEEAVYELLRVRRILCGSYVYGYYLEDNGYNKTIFEFMQNDLEEATEKLSEMIVRPYLQTPRVKIVYMTGLIKRKRQEFITAVLKGLIPPETPPSMRRTRRRRYPGLMGIDPVEDEDLSQAIIASLEELDPNNPWVKDTQGKHTNLTAIYDWPDYDSDEEANSACVLTASLLGICSRNGCSKPRARNPRTGIIHDFCSLACSQGEKLEENRTDIAESEMDFSMDLLIALEMSKLQMIEDNNKLQETCEESNRSEASFDAFQNVEAYEDHQAVAKPSFVIEDNHQILLVNDLDSELASQLYCGKDESLLNPAASEPIIMDNDDNRDSADDECEISNVIVPSSQETANFPHISEDSPPKTSITFYMKNSCDSEELNSRNINFSSDSYCKTEKQLFPFHEKSDGVDLHDEGND